MATTPEGGVKDAIKRALKVLGPERCSFYMPMQNGFGEQGIPDIIISIDGEFWGVETKAPKKPKTPFSASDPTNRFGDECVTSNQKRKLTEIHKAGGKAYVIDEPAQFMEALLHHGVVTDED